MRLDHYTIRTERLEETVRFYEDVVELKSGFRPRPPMNGAWLYHGRCRWTTVGAGQTTRADRNGLIGKLGGRS